MHFSYKALAEKSTSYEQIQYNTSGDLYSVYVAKVQEMMANSSKESSRVTAMERFQVETMRKAVKRTLFLSSEAFSTPPHQSPCAVSRHTTAQRFLLPCCKMLVIKRQLEREGH